MSHGYISDILFHFVGKDLQKEEEQYDLLKKIIQEGWISFPPHEQQISPGSVEIHSMRSRKLEEMINPKCVCFSDIPIEEISLHVTKYSQFGLGFSRDFLLLKGANPVFYIGENSTAFVQSQNATYDKVNMKEYYQENFSKTIYYFFMCYLPYTQKVANDKKSDTEYRDTCNILNFLINVFSHFKPWNDKLDATNPNNFYYEREWRALNNINFALSDVEIICVPKNFIGRFKRDFPDYRGKIEEIQ
jgi:hypothetical protein